jgi:hypothetical protein
MLVMCLAAAGCLVAQAPAADGPAESGSNWLWDLIQQGKISAAARYRFEMCDRDGAPFTGAAYAPTLRLALGYETPSFHGLSVFAEGAAVLVTGPADYSIPTLPSQNRPDRPAILEPRGVDLNQAYLKWRRGAERRSVALTAGRQELMLNDGRFVSTSFWRQDHETYDAAKLNAELPGDFAFTYAFINRYYRVVGHDAIDGKPPMHTHLLDLAWKKRGRVKVSVYGLLLDYRSPAQYTLSTETWGVRATGPYQLNPEWSVLYTAEFANQRNFGDNPNRVDVNYHLYELGPAWRGIGLKAGYAFLGGRSATDIMTTPLAQPSNGWTDLFSTVPSVGASHGLEARYLSTSGPLRRPGGPTYTLTYYDYHSDSHRIYYGSEFDLALAYKIKRVTDRWEVGWRVGRYRADGLYTNTLRTSVWSGFTL